MIKAEYKGISDEILGCDLRNGKVYPISTYCSKNKLVVRVMTVSYTHLRAHET